MLELGFKLLFFFKKNKTYVFILFVFACIHGYLMQAEAYGGQKKVLDSL